MRELFPPHTSSPKEQSQIERPPILPDRERRHHHADFVRLQVRHIPPFFKAPVHCLHRALGKSLEASQLAELQSGLSLGHQIFLEILDFGAHFCIQHVLEDCQFLELLVRSELHEDL